MMKNENRKEARIFAMILFILIPLLVGGFSAMLTAEDMKIYETFDKPPLAPPAWLFPIAWTVLYILMGLASGIVFISDAEADRKRKALRVYFTQLAMNLFWSTLFFTYARYLIALIWLLVMWLLILVTVIRFFRIRKAAGLMMCPLFLWTTFAAYLNLACYLMSVSPKAMTI